MQQHIQHLESYKNRIRQRYYDVAPPKLATLFLFIFNHFTLDETLKIFSEEDMQEKIAPNLSTETVFSDLAIFLVRKDEVEKLQFLIETLRYVDLPLIAKSGSNITLLHEACLYTAHSSAKLLIAFKADPCAQDNDGSTPVHRLMENFLRDIKKYKELLNIKKLVSNDTIYIANNNGITPLHIAIFNSNPTAINILTKANIIRKEEITELKESVKIQDFKKGTLQYIEENIFTKIKIAYLKTVFLSENINNLKELLKELKLINNWPILSAEDRLLYQYIVFYCYYTTTTHSVSSKSLTKQFRTKKKYITQEAWLYFLLESATFYLQENKQNHISWLDYLHRLLPQIENPQHNSLASYYNETGYLYLEEGEYNTAIELLTYCLKNNKNNIEIAANLLSIIHYNLGLAQYKLLDNTNAVKNFILSNSYNNNQDSFMYCIYSLWSTTQYQLILDLCTNTVFQELAIVVEAQTKFLLNKINNDILLGTILSNSYSSEYAKSLSYTIIAHCYIRNGNPKLAIPHALKAFEESKKDKSSLMGVNIQNMLQVYIECEEYKEALDFLNEYLPIYPKEFEKDNNLKFFTFICYLANNQHEQAEIYLQKINQSNLDVKNLMDLYKSFIWYILDLDKADNFALPIINQLSTLESNNPEIEALRILINASNNINISVETNNIDENFIRLLA